jgi:hypothetical protein
MEVIRQERPGKTESVCISEDCREPLEKLLAVRIILKDFSALDTPGNNML